jgi:hypothetical protein
MGPFKRVDGKGFDPGTRGGANMFGEDCHGRLRFRLNDDSGVLRFVEFEILNAPRCRDTESRLRMYLVGRALADVDVDYLRSLSCVGNGECLQTIIREVRKYQDLFVRNAQRESAPC